MGTIFEAGSEQQATYDADHSTKWAYCFEVTCKRSAEEGLQGLLIKVKDTYVFCS
jgi:hypothetical protein